MSRYRIVGAPRNPPVMEFDGPDAHAARKRFEALHPEWHAARVQVFVDDPDAGAHDDPFEDEAMPDGDWMDADAVCEVCGVPSAFDWGDDGGAAVCPACVAKARP